MFSVVFPYSRDLHVPRCINSNKTLTLRLFVGWLGWMKEVNSQGLGRTSGASGISDSSRPQPEQADRSRYTFGLPTTVSLGSLQSPVCS